ncbi:MAG: MFS transporter [Armatimonadetes bacterium]|nr:MFS transporter [Armatimonadota bacterium]
MPAERPAQNRERILFFMAVLHLYCHALLSLLTPLYVAIQKDFALPRVEPVTGLSTCGAVTFALATLVAGLLVDRLPSRLVAGGGLVVQGLGLVAMAAAPTLGWARVWVIVSAVGAAGYHPVSARVIAGLYPEAVGRAMGLAGMGAGLGFFLGPRFSGRVTGLAGWRMAMGLAGWGAVAVAAAYVLFTREPILSERPRPEGQVPAGPRQKAVFVLALAALGLALIPRDFAGGGIETLNALYLQHAQGLSVGLVGALLGYKGLLSLVTNPIFAWLSDRGSRLWWWAGTLLLSALCGAAIPFLPRGAAMAALVLHGMFLLANYPIFESALLERVPARLRGRAYALILAVVGSFAAFAPKFVGARVDALVSPAAVHAGPELFQALYLALAAVMLLGLAGVPLLVVVRRRSDGMHG